MDGDLGSEAMEQCDCLGTQGPALALCYQETQRMHNVTLKLPKGTVCSPAEVMEKLMSGSV